MYQKGEKEIKTMNGSVRSDRGINTSKSAVLLGLHDPSGFRMTERRSFDDPDSKKFRKFVSRLPLFPVGNSCTVWRSLARPGWRVRGAAPRRRDGRTDLRGDLWNADIPEAPSLPPSIPLPLVHTQFYIFPLARAPGCRLQR